MINIELLANPISFKRINFIPISSKFEKILTRFQSSLCDVFCIIRYQFLASDFIMNFNYKNTAINLFFRELKMFVGST